MFIPSSEENAKNCMFCGKTHEPEKCTTVTDTEKRINVLRKQGRCFRCLKKRHTARDCRSVSRCTNCSGRHHAAICKRGGVDRQPENKEKTHNAEEQDTKTDQATQLMSSSGCANDTTIVLQSASIWIRSESKRFRVRGIFDTGSQWTFISRRLASKLGCHIICKEKLSISSFGSTKCDASELDLVKIGLEMDEGVFTIEALVVATISAPVPMKIKEEWLNQPALKDLKLADKLSENDTLDVDIIIGNDHYGSLVTGKIIKTGRVIAMESKFGWLLSGPLGSQEGATEVSCFKINAFPTTGGDHG